MSESRDHLLTRTFITLADTLVGEYDPVDLLGLLCEQATVLLDVSAAGVLLIDDQDGELEFAAASSERSHLLEMLAVSVEAGPCLECLHRGVAVSTSDVAADGERWPRFALGARAAGFRAVHALPMRLREDVLGVLTLLHEDVHHLTDDDRLLGQALADAATIGLLHDRALRRTEILAEQLQSALGSRVVIEQAKGALAQGAGIEVDAAFVLLRDHARSHGLRLTDVARDLVNRDLTSADVVRR